MYNNQNSYSPRNYHNNFNGNNAGNYSMNRSGYSRNTQRPAGKSGCKIKRDHVTKDGVKKSAVITGWKATRRFGLVSFVATPAHSKYQHQKNLDRNLICMVAKVSSSFGTKLVWCYWNTVKEVLTMHELKMYASPKWDCWKYIVRKK